MNKNNYTNECIRQLTEYFNLLKQNKVDDELRSRIQGFINAGEFMGVINHQEAVQIMDDTHFQVFGMSNTQRKAKKDSIKFALKGDVDAFFDVPAINRKI